MEKLCGACAQKQGLEKEERIALAMSRQPNVLYACPICEQEHMYVAKVVERNVPQPSQAEEKPKIEKKKAKKMVEQEQFAFDF